MRVWSAHINSLLAFNMWISIYVWHITECFAVRFAKFEGVAITRFTIVNCSVTSIIPFYASRFHNNRGLKRFWQISWYRHCYIADHLFYFDIWFRPDFFHTEWRPSRTFSSVLFGGRVAGRWSILQKPELISAARWSVLHCQRPGNATLKRRTRQCVSFDVRSLPSSINIRS